MPVNSWQFLLVAAAAVAFARIADHVAIKRLGILTFNVVFIATYLHDPLSAAVLGGLLASIYLAGQLRRKAATRWTASAQMSVITILWAFLFLVKDPELLGSANPFSQFPVAIIGISYLVFRGISYLMESDLPKQTNLLDFLNYMLFFPAILAGPIERYSSFTSQYLVPERDPTVVVPALHRIANGFIKKFCIADNLAPFSVSGIGDPAASASLVLWIAALGQLLLIYLDFSGYCDIAIGLARLMGIRVRENFARPFAAVNVREFWDRWHVSMSSLMRDYVFTPITKVILSRTRRAWHWTLITAAYFFVMVLIALWHGTALGFLVFGVLHGGILAVIQMRQRRSTPRRTTVAPSQSIVQRTLLQAATYAFVSLTLVLWMAPNEQWLRFYFAMAGLR
ncbi:MAG: MBOAT family O-acyltransferase [Gammaproteobacteria bacterium]